MWNLASHPEGRTQTDVVLEENTEKTDIWK